MPLSCDSNGGVISVSYALFGRQVDGNVFCLYENNPSDEANRKTDCNKTAETDRQKIREMCDGQSTCTINNQRELFGDPCRGTYKYTRVAYACVDENGMINDRSRIRTGEFKH